MAKMVLFVCKANSCRSQMAEGWLKSFKDPKIIIESAGLKSTEVNQNAVKVMGEVGVDLTNHTSKPISDFEPDNWDEVISLCGCSASLPEPWKATQDWNLDDPPAKDPGDLSVYRRVRDEIKERCQQLQDNVNHPEKVAEAAKVAGKEIDMLIDTHPIVIFSKEFCPYSKKAEDVLTSIGASFFAKEPEDAQKKPAVQDPAAWQNYLNAKTSAGVSVPKVFIGKKFIGGGDDVQRYLESGELLELATKAGAVEVN